MTARHTPRTPALPEGVDISFGTAADIGLLRPFWLALHRIHQEADPELAPHVDDETSWRKRRALYEHCLESPDAFLLLVRRDGSLIGYALVAVEPDGDVLWSDTWQVGDKVAELETMYLVPEERGRGLAGCSSTPSRRSSRREASTTWRSAPCRETRAPCGSTSGAGSARRGRSSPGSRRGPPAGKPAASARTSRRIDARRAPSGAGRRNHASSSPPGGAADGSRSSGP